MRLVFIFPRFYFFKISVIPLQNSSLGQIHIEGDVPAFGSSTGMVFSLFVTLFWMFSEIPK